MEKKGCVRSFEFKETNFETELLREEQEGFSRGERDT